MFLNSAKILSSTAPEYWARRDRMCRAVSAVGGFRVEFTVAATVRVFGLGLYDDDPFLGWYDSLRGFLDWGHSWVKCPFRPQL